jgi:hypothetical protein
MMSDLFRIATHPKAYKKIAKNDFADFFGEKEHFLDHFLGPHLKSNLMKM